MNRRGLRRGNWSVQELERFRALFWRRGVADIAALLRRSPGSVQRKAVALLGVAAHKSDWSAAEDERLRLGWGAIEPRLLGMLLGRSAGEVQRRVAVLRPRPRSGPWTRGEAAQLKDLYGTRSDADLEICLQRPAAEIAALAARLCLRKDKRFAKDHPRSSALPARMPRWTAAEVERLGALYPDADNLEVARLLGRSVLAVANKANQLGLKKSSSLLARIGRANVNVRYAPAPPAPPAELTAGGRA